MLVKLKPKVVLVIMVVVVLVDTNMDCVLEVDPKPNFFTFTAGL